MSTARGLKVIKNNECTCNDARRALRSFIPVLVLAVWDSPTHIHLVSTDSTSYRMTYTHTFNGPLSRTTRVSRYQKGKTNLDFTETTDSEWQWHQLGRVQVCTSLNTDNHANTSPLSFLQARCPSCYPTNSVKALKAWSYNIQPPCTSSTQTCDF